MAMDRYERQGCYSCAGVLSALGVLLMLILLPMTWKKVEYYQGCPRRRPFAPPRLASTVGRHRRVVPTVARRVAGLRSQKSTGKVWRDEVYEAGRYGIGPDYTFRCYPLNVQNFNERLSVWSKSSGSDAGSTVYLDVSYQYLLNPEKLGELYSMVALNFEGLVASRTQDAIRNTAPLFGIDSYLSQRPLIEATLQRNVSRAIADLHMDVLSFQLRDIEPEDDYQSARLAVAIQVESNAKEAYSQEATLVREQTAVEVLEIENDADAVAKKATASASKIKENAVTEADEKVEVARLQGLKDLYDELGFTSEKHKASLDYLLTLMASSSNKEYVAFDSMGKVTTI